VTKFDLNAPIHLKPSKQLPVLADLKPQQSLVLEHNYQTLQAALDGLGVANGSSAPIADDVAAGRLVIPFPGPKLPIGGYCAYVPNAKLNDPTVKGFYEWLRRIGASESSALEEA